MRYIKTRNWSCNKWSFRALQITHLLGVRRGDSYTDGDGKFFKYTNNILIYAALKWYFGKLQRWTEGMIVEGDDEAEIA